MNVGAALKAAGIEPVKLHRSLPCLGGTLLVGEIVTDSYRIQIAVVPRGDGSWTAEFDDCTETRHCKTVREARAWLALLNFGATRDQADEIADNIAAR